MSAIFAEVSPDLLTVARYSLDSPITPIPTPPLHVFFIHFSMRLFGSSDFAVDLPSVMFGILAIPATFALGSQLFGNKTGLLGGLLLALSPLHLWVSQDARFYPLLVLLPLLSFYGLTRALLRNERRWWLCFVVSSVLLLYHSFYSLVILLAQTLF
ncbi:MAG: glycosyltransferase family 39 protein, partial [Chloroflexi bacterium]|nr:glycosyltransferase family 39 protein [Chloroflexota bacterium]